MSIATKIVKVALATAAGCVTLAAGAGVATADSTGQLEVRTITSAEAAPYSYECYGFHLTSPSAWEGGCYVYSGEMRTITYCSDSSVRVGDWLAPRPDPWFVSGDCDSYQVTAVATEGRG